ncbi:hypothetical protein ACSSV5_000733 [Psychroflexus sp. MBR-150]|jgi:hypothetical protein
MEQFKRQNILNFIKELPTDDACKAFLAKLKSCHSNVYLKWLSRGN